MEGSSRVTSFSERLYRTLLVAYPKEFRQQYGEQLVQVFGDLCREELEQHGRKGLLVLWIRTLGDLAVSVFSQRSGLAMFSFSLVRSGGLAIAIGGVLNFVSKYLSYTGGMTASIAYPESLSSRLALLLGPIGMFLLAAGLATLGLYLMRGTMRGIRKAKILAAAGVVLASISAIVWMLLAVVLVISGAPAVGGPGGIPADSAQVTLLDILPMLGYWGMVIASVAIGGVLLYARSLGRWWFLLPISGILTHPLLVGVSWGMAVAPMSNFLTSPFFIVIYLVPYALATFGWLTLGFLMVSRWDELLSGAAQVE